MQCVYKIINKTNGKFYVGRTFDIVQRWKRHRSLLLLGQHHCTHLQNSWNKYGENNFDVHTVQMFETGDEVEDLRLAKTLEQEFIEMYKPTGILYNKSWSAETGVSKGEDHVHYSKMPWDWMYSGDISRWREMIESRNMNGENNPFYGRTHSEETLKVLSEKCANYGEDNGFFGKHHSDETKRLIGSKNRGRLAGGKNPSARKVIVLGEYFDTVKEACEYVGISAGTFYKRVRSDDYPDYKYVD
ncbi:NUMOD3 domain-containing DNA-binding protein [Paenibacillus amylolyticus]|uniref:NUMOD3 domain-containing DNA-binding protein n=1 Tax=Paenibacillus amylolyticus TaxID=1451 RepID=UPI003EBE494C